ncbi:MAG: hypothetical protein J6A03_04845 [Lachnospiraceae bacterium]|nr:hypothetical protein [Lachnospiraceae bacterium]
MNYMIKHMDMPLVAFTYKKEVEHAVVNKELSDYLPLPLKRIINSQLEFVAGNRDNLLYVNEDGCWLIESWLNDRETPVNRAQFHKYVKDGMTAKQWMLENHGCSFTDCYWIMREDESLTWDDVKYYNYKDVDTLQVIMNGHNRMYKGINATLGGELEKFWYISKENDTQTLKLCKKTDKLSDVLNAREVIASLIYQKQGYPYFTDYQFVFDRNHDVVGCKCKAFTSEQKELITAYDLLEEINETQVKAVYERIIEQAISYGGDADQIRNYMDLQTIVDYLILNRDRHQGNIGFLRDSDTLQIISPAPVYDSGSSKYMEQQTPEGITGTTVNGLYDTEDECLSHVTSWDVIDLAKLPKRSELQVIYDQCSNITERRKAELLDLYEGKVEYIKEKMHDRNYLPDDLEIE